MAIRLIIADDHAIFRQGLKSVLRFQPDVEVVAEVGRASELESVLAATPCDVLLLDLQMERWMADDIERLARSATIVVLTASERNADGLGAIRMGARAVVQKRFAVETLMEAIRAAMDGLVWMPPELQAELVEAPSERAENQLTSREREIVRCVAMGMRNAEVATRLTITEGTVKKHLNNIFQKLDIRDRVEVALYAMRAGLVNPHQRNR
jgi:two-component system NarL family response regulator